MPSANRLCTVDGCDRPHKARGFCLPHYQQWRRDNLNTISGPADDPRMGFVERLTAFLGEAPEGLLTAEDRDLITGVALTAAMAARGVVPLTPEIRYDVLHRAVKRATIGAEL